MDNPGYIGLTRMKGLADELRVVANNIANLATTGFRGESVVFAEVLAETTGDGGALSMAQPRAHVTDLSEGGFGLTGGELDLAIEGDAFFRVQTPEGPRLTRAGAFRLSPDGLVVDASGAALLDQGGAPLAIPDGTRRIAVGPDGTVSADGVEVGAVGLVTVPADSLLRDDGVRFRSDAQVAPSETARVLQGYLEDSNVDPVSQMARMIEVQRAYELGQSFLDLEDGRLREAVRTLGRTG
jgi:flagellar basal-body rod protein FlgF